MKYLSIMLTLLSSSICFAHRDLETGTFLPRDPIGYSDGQSVYCYVNCNPICAVYEAYETRPVEWSDGTTGNPDRQRANTKDEEAELGLLNEGMRYRDLETGTFLTRDPIGYADGPNVYCYVHCNPITSFDPLGLNENRIEAFIPDLGIDLSYSTDPWFDSGEFALYDGTYLDALAAPIEAVIEGSAAAIGWTAESLWDGAVGWYDVACAMGNSIAWCGGEILSAPDTILDNVTETDMYGRMFAAQNTPIPYDDAIVGTLGLLRVSGTWLKGFRALDKIEDVVPTPVFRQGTFADEAIDWKGNYLKGKQWAGENPLTTPNYAQRYGLPAENTTPDWVAGGETTGPYRIQPAPPSHNSPINTGGGPEILPDNPDSVRLDWFHMPDD